MTSTASLDRSPIDSWGGVFCRPFEVGTDRALRPFGGDKVSVSNVNVVLEQDSAERHCLMVMYGFGGAADFGGILERDSEDGRTSGNEISGYANTSCVTGGGLGGLLESILFC
jgi:hypothetical protein